jgi:hypothetical protein
MAEPGECEFPSSHALLEYATHRLLWSWYTRDREAQTARPDWEPSPDFEPDPPGHTEEDDDLEPEVE